MIPQSRIDVKPTHILACIGFFTKIPVTGYSDPDVRLSDALWAAPIVGLLIGAVGASAFALAAFAGFSGNVSAILALSATIFLTGALHEDGAADTADGFGGGRDREQKLQIMRDSRIGTYGVLILVLSVVARWSALSGLSPLQALLALLAAHAASRSLLPVFMLRVEPARNDGLSANAGASGEVQALIAIAAGALALMLLGVTFGFITMLILAAWWFGLKLLCQNQIGGQTGDVLGALQHGAEIVVLMIAALKFS